LRPEIEDRMVPERLVTARDEQFVVPVRCGDNCANRKNSAGQVKVWLLDLLACVDAVWTRPWTVRQEFMKQTDQENRVYYEPRCVEGNYGLPGLLHGAQR
jgi:hypothetical protein